MMHRPTVFALLYLSIGARALTYWVEDQCGDKGVDESVMDEVRSMGVEGSKRLRDDGNENMAYSFKTIFKVERSDEAVRSQALTAFDIIAAMTKTDQREPSDIRIYCDEDNDQSGDANARWTKASPNTNKRRTREMAQYIDKHNKVLRAIGSYGCADVDEGDKFTLAQTYRWKEDPDTVAATQNPNRETITICDEGLVFEKTPKLLKDFNEQDKRIVQLPVADFDATLSMTIFHEFCHLTAVLRLPGSIKEEPELFGWGQVKNAPADVTSKSADAFAWLGMLALMETHNMRLARAESDDELEKKRAAEDKGNGGFVWIDPSKAPQRKIKRTPSASGAYYNALANLKIRGKKLIKFSV